MKLEDFMYECTSRTLLPGEVFFNEKIQQAILANDDKRLIELLDTEF